jgi:hypothetical protein
MAKSSRHFIIFVSFLVLSSVWATDGFALESPECSIRSIDLESTPQADVIWIKSDKPIGKWHDFILDRPNRIVVDLDDCRCPGKLKPERRDGRFVSALRYARHPQRVIRIAANIGDGIKVRRSVERTGDGLAIYIEKESDTYRIEDIFAKIDADRRLTVGIRTSQDYSFKPRVFALQGPNRLVLDLPHASRGFQSPSIDGVEEPKIRVGRQPDSTRLVLDFGSKAIPDFKLDQATGEILLFVDLPAGSQAHDDSRKEALTKSEPDKDQEDEGEIAPAETPDLEDSSEQKGKSEAESFFEKGDETLKPFGQESGFGKETAGEMEKPPWEKEGESEKGSAFEFSGKFRNLLAHDTQEDNEFEDDTYNHAELKLEAKYTLNPQIYAVLGVDLNHFAYRNDGDWDDDADIRFWNSYFNLSGARYNLRVGNQVVKWGKSDEIGPIDVINPEDFRDGFIRTRSERKVPIPMVNMDLFEGVYKLQGLFIPFFYKSDLDMKGRDWALFDHFQQEIGSFGVDNRDYPNTLENSGAGVRFSGTISNLDYAFDYLHIRDSLPSVSSLMVPAGFPLPVSSSATIKDLARFAQMTDQPVVLKYVRQDIVGFEFETTWKALGLRGEAAYTNPRSFITDELSNVEKSVFQYVLGADYRGPESFYVNLQFSQAIILDYDDRILFFDEVTNSVYGTVTKGILDENVELGLRGYYNFTNEDFFCNPNIVFKYWQNLNLELGVEFVGGPSDTALWVYRDNDEFYGILRWFF